MYIDEIRKTFKDVQPIGIIKIQNIVNFVYEFPSQEIDPSNVFSYKPPFQKTWLEFKVPEYMNDNGKKIYVDNGVRNKMVGVYITVDYANEDNETFDDFFQLTFNYFMEIRGKNMSFMQSTLYPDFKTGKIERDTDLLTVPTEEMCTMLKEIEGEEGLGLSIIKRLVSYCFSSIPTFFNFYHCKNVTLKKTNFDQRLIKSRVKKGYKNYFEKFYTLDIEPMKKVLKRDYNCDKIGVGKSLQAYHIIPGHFKPYTKDENGKGGLFGKLEGVWWWESFVKGSKAVGVINKDYDFNLKNITPKTKLKSRI